MRRSVSISALGLVLLGAAGGCVLGEMHPGESCATCHTGGRAPRFGAAGTVFPRPTAGKDDGIPDVRIDITDSAGLSISLASNDVGNFYTTEALAPPLEVTLWRDGAASVSSMAPSGDCNSCHTAGSSLGPVYVP